jgi:hypothetical protein
VLGPRTFVPSFGHDPSVADQDATDQWIG